MDGTEEIMIELQISQITDFIQLYRRKWKEQVEILNSDRNPQTVIKLLLLQICKNYVL